MSVVVLITDERGNYLYRDGSLQTRVVSELVNFVTDTLTMH
jgi:hypothetical protein